MRLILTTDLHLTDNPKDYYKWDLFPFIKKQAKKRKVDYILILGDLTDAKDNHSSVLVNLIVDSITSLAQVCPVFILMGNHDYIDPASPFFNFLSSIPNITFISDPKALDIDGTNTLFLPHTRTPIEDWEDINFKQYEFVFMHETINGSLASNGQKMEGLKLSYFKGFEGKIFSGDIHVPQTLGKGMFEYVGCPYHLRFNDKFIPRILYVQNQRQKDVNFKCISKHTLTIHSPAKITKMFEDGLINRNDQIKVRLTLKKHEFVEWNVYKQDIRDICEELGLDLCGIELKHKRKIELSTEKKGKQVGGTDYRQTVKNFSEKEDLSEAVIETGLNLLDGED